MPKRRKISKETDSAYILKLILFIFLGSLWLRVGVNNTDWFVPLPLGFLVGLLLTSHEHFRIDRKIEYAILVCVMIISFFLPFGIVLGL
jgi:uncharacterized membrane protein YphA (DoxX/SURF4 family)